MEPVQNRLPPFALRVLAEGIAFVGIERPLFPGQTAEQSALRLLAAYLKAHNPVEPRSTMKLQKLLRLCSLPERVKVLENYKKAYGIELADYQSCLQLLNE